MAKKVSNIRPDYNAKPISKENRANGVATMKKVGNDIKQVAKAVTNPVGYIAGEVSKRVNQPKNKPIKVGKMIDVSSSKEKAKAYGSVSGSIERSKETSMGGIKSVKNKKGR